MNRFKNQLLMAAGFAILAGLISGITAAPAIAQAVKAALVKNIDEPGRSPFQEFNVNGLSCPSIQPGKRLVVEHISGTYATDGTLVDFRFVLGSTKFSLPVQNQGVANNLTTYYYGGPIKAYLNSGETCNFQTAGGFAQTVIFTNSISGYMVDLTN